MGVGTVGEYSSFLQDYRIPTIPADIGSVPPHDNSVIIPEAIDSADVHVQTFSANNNRKSAPLEDISITFNRQEDFGYIGQDSDIRSLDMEKAITDMKRDQVLQQYQYFVGSTRNVHMDSPDGIVVKKF